MPPAPQLHHILPLCSASITAGLSLFQYPLFLSFLQARPSIAGRPLSTFWDAFIRKALAIVLGFTLTSSVSGFLARRSLSGTSAASWYGYGALCALGHFAFVPFVSTSVQNIAQGKPSERQDKALDRPFNWDQEQKIEETNRNQQANWFWWHTVRCVVADIPAVWCFATGFSKAFM